MLSQEAKTIREQRSYLTEVEHYVNNMRYGSVTLIVQDGKVIQIDKTEKIRIRN